MSRSESGKLFIAGSIGELVHIGRSCVKCKQCVVKAAQGTDVFFVSHGMSVQLTSTAGGGDGKYRFK